MTPFTVLVASEAFGEKLSAARATRAIGRGLRAGNAELEADPCPLEEPPGATDKPPGATEEPPGATGRPRGATDKLPGDLDARMHRARAVVIAVACLSHETLLQRDAAFEIATRARQTGVPCYAVAGSDELDLFEARILDLQVILEARNERGLTDAGRKLAALM